LMTRSVTSPLSRPALAPVDLQAAGIAMAGTASCASWKRDGTIFGQSRVSDFRLDDAR
jgi:hypothetical protein